MADLPAGWKAEDMTYMLQVDASIFVRELRILPQFGMLSSKFSYVLPLANLVIGTELFLRPFIEEILKFKTFLEQPARTRFSEGCSF